MYKETGLCDITFVEDTTIKVNSGYASALSMSVNGGAAVTINAYEGVTANTSVNAGTECTVAISGFSNTFSGVKVLNNGSSRVVVEDGTGTEAHFTPPVLTSGVVTDVIWFRQPQSTVTVKVSRNCTLRMLK